MEEEKQYQRTVKHYIDTIRDYEISKQINVTHHECQDDQDIDLYPFIKVKVDGSEVTLSDILKDNKKYESKMTGTEWNCYQEMLDEMGLLEVD